MNLCISYVNKPVGLSSKGRVETTVDFVSPSWEGNAQDDDKPFLSSVVS